MNQTGISQSRPIGCWVVLLIPLIILYGCLFNNSPTYKVNYSIEVHFVDGDRDTLDGEQNFTTYTPENISVGLSSRLRDSPCLFLWGNIGVSGVNMACGVRSFKVLVFRMVKM